MQAALPVVVGAHALHIRQIRQGEDGDVFQVVALHLRREHVPEKLGVDEHAKPADRKLKRVFHVRQLAHELGVDVVVLQIAIQRAPAGRLARYFYKRHLLKIAQVCALAKLRKLLLVPVPGKTFQQRARHHKKLPLLAQRHNLVSLGRIVD